MSEYESHEEQVEKLVAPGWPAVEPRIDEIFGWLYDPNCTGFHVALRFLRGVGRPLVPHIKRALPKEDPDLRSTLLGALVEEWPREWVAEIAPELETLAWMTDACENDLAALGLLVRHRLGDLESLRVRIERRIDGAEASIRELRKMKQALEG